MAVERNVITRSLKEAGVSQGLLVSPIFFTIYTSGILNWVDDRVSGIEVQWLAEDVGSTVTRHELCPMNRKLDV